MSKSIDVELKNAQTSDGKVLRSRRALLIVRTFRRGDEKQIGL